MLIVYWPITIKFRTCEQTSKPQTNYRCCLWFSYLAPYWLISRNTITFHKYFWCSRFCEFHSNNAYCSHLVVPSEMRSVIESGKSLLVEIEALHPKHNSRIPDHSNDWNQVWNTSSTDGDPVPGIPNPQFEM